MADFTERELEHYYRKESDTTENAILSFLHESRNQQMIVFGAKAVNAHLPEWLEKETKDWDILAPKNAKGEAEELASKLNERYGGDYFSVEPAIHEGTFRVRSRVTGTVVADISIKNRDIDFTRRKGVNYATQDFLEEEATNNLSDPAKEFRHNKERDTLQRIAIAKTIKKRQKSQRRRREQDGDITFGVQGLRW